MYFLLIKAYFKETTKMEKIDQDSLFNRQCKVLLSTCTLEISKGQKIVRHQGL